MNRLPMRVIARFLRIEASSALLLLAATVAALVWANSPWSAGYEQLWVSGDARHWVNDGLMAVFFFVVGLEIKRELVEGRLSSPRDAALPAFAALGGMVLPALIFLAFNGGREGAHGWGIPMATDIAFAVGVLSLLGDRVSSELKVFLLGIAIADDVGAIVVIAVFYSSGVSFPWLALGVVALAAYALLHRFGPRSLLPVFAVVAVAVWFATYESGIHATIAGVALGLTTPARSRRDPKRAVAERVEDALHPWTSYVVLPVFALANAGVALSGRELVDAAHSPVTIGVAVGLVVGKVAGITGATALAVRLRAARLPPGVTARQVLGIGAVAGTGFTVSIFITGLAFTDDRLVTDAKVGVLAGSVLAAAAGAFVLTSRATRPTR